MAYLYKHHISYNLTQNRFYVYPKFSQLSARRKNYFLGRKPEVRCRLSGSLLKKVDVDFFQCLVQKWKNVFWVNLALFFDWDRSYSDVDQLLGQVFLEDNKQRTMTQNGMMQPWCLATKPNQKLDPPCHPSRMYLSVSHGYWGGGGCIMKS